MIYLAATYAVSLLVVGTGALLIIHALVREHREESEAWRRERADLLQWAKDAPTASIRHYNDNQEIVTPPAVNPEVDDDFWISREDLAEHAARDEVTHGD